MKAAIEYSHIQFGIALISMLSLTSKKTTIVFKVILEITWIYLE